MLLLHRAESCLSIVQKPQYKSNTPTRFVLVSHSTTVYRCGGASTHCLPLLFLSVDIIVKHLCHLDMLSTQNNFCVSVKI